MGATAAYAWCHAEGLAAAIPIDSSPVHEARFYHSLEDGSVGCELCPRRCHVQNGKRGYCRVRENRDGKYYTLVYGRPCVTNLDPIEKKPLFHVYPGTKAFSIATVGCNIHCKFCQNFDISQASPEEVNPTYFSPEEIVDMALQYHAKTLAFTYNEPTIFYEYMHDCAQAAKNRNLDAIIISNGFINDAPQKTLFPLVKAIKIDLKAFTQSFYGGLCEGRLQPILDTLQRLSKSGVWYEIVNLMIPTLNDNTQDIQRMANWIVKELGPDVPIHFTRFTPLYRLKNLPPTPAETLLHAREIAMKEGCHFVYCGNQPGLEGENTICPGCKKVVIKRYGFRIIENQLAAGKCAFCKQLIPGVWA
jgi:pyruvate formate lyase activating enzyme